MEVSFLPVSIGAPVHSITPHSKPPSSAGMLLVISMVFVFLKMAFLIACWSSGMDRHSRALYTASDPAQQVW